MKSIKIFPVVIGLFFAVSCKKIDLQQALPAETIPTTTLMDNPAASGMTDWKTINTWSAGDINTITGEISDMAITKDISENGIILVYTKEGNAVHQLPYSTQSAGNAYSWYYQVSEGKIIISLEANGDVANLRKQQGFTYLILSANQLEDLESKGLSAAELFQIPYEKAVAGFDSK